MINFKMKAPLLLLFLSFTFCFPQDIPKLEEQLAQPALTGHEKIKLLTRLCELNQDAEPVKAVSYGREALELLGSHTDPDTEIRVLLSLAWAVQNTGEFEPGLNYGERARELALQTGDKIAAATACNHISRIQFQLGFLDRSLKSAIQALRLFEELGDKQNLAKAYKNIGNVYDELKNNELALTHYIKSLEISEELGDTKGIIRAVNNIGNIYHRTKDYDKAMEYYQRTLNLTEKIGWQMGQLVARVNIATIYSEQDQPARALETDLESLEICKKIGQKRFTAIVLSNIGVSYRLLKQYNKALEYVFEALAMAKEMKNKDIIRNFYEELSYIYDAMKDYRKAFFYLKKYKAVCDEIYSEECQQNISELWTSFKTEKKEREIRWLTQNNKIQQLQLERQELVRNFLLLVSLLVLILTVVTFNRYRTKKRAEQELKESEKKLKAMNQAKDKLFSIIAHDLGNPLNGLMLSSEYLEHHYQDMNHQEVKEMLHQIYEGSDQISRLLDKLLQWAASQLGKLEVAPEDFSLSPLVADAVELAAPSAREKGIALKPCVGDRVRVRADRRMVETVIRNLVSNAVKYTCDGGEVGVSCKEEGDIVSVTVSDNGIGIPGEKLAALFDPGKSRSTRGTAGEQGIGLGLVLCKEFVERNGGTIRVESAAGVGEETGTKVFFTLPSPGEAARDDHE